MRYTALFTFGTIFALIPGKFTRDSDFPPLALLNTSETIRDLDVPEGRRLLHDFFHDRRTKHRLEINTMLDCWRLCRRAREIKVSDGRRVQFETNLGFKIGTRVFFEEIVGVYYYNSVLGLVYFGATLLLVAVALHLAGHTIWIALAGFGIEAFFLLVLAVVTAYSRPDEPAAPARGLAQSEHTLQALNGTVREMTNAVSDLFRLMSQSDLRQDVLLTRLTEYMNKSSAEQMRLQGERLAETNDLLREMLHALQSGDARHAGRSAASGIDAPVA